MTAVLGELAQHLQMDPAQRHRAHAVTCHDLVQVVCRADVAGDRACVVEVGQDAIDRFEEGSDEAVKRLDALLDPTRGAPSEHDGGHV